MKTLDEISLEQCKMGKMIDQLMWRRKWIAIEVSSIPESTTVKATLVTVSITMTISGIPKNVEW
ncbi:hypothetical protein Droror1_Dr00016297, partial [Drosera rotundifolia]